MTYGYIPTRISQAAGRSMYHYEGGQDDEAMIYFYFIAKSAVLQVQIE